MSASPTAGSRPGDIVAGKYRVERELGAGGMGVVVAAVHIHLNERVALKMLLPEGGDSATARDRFLREAQTAVKIKSEHVARVIDLGFLESGAPYMAMELLEGKDLSKVIEQGGPMPVAPALDYVLQACEAIAEAHVLGMVHRDLKPANLFLTAHADGSPLVKVLDFGISKAPVWAHGEASLTSTGALMGSPSYMSPEQIRDAKYVDARSDIWAVGMILYELLTGRVAFSATTLSGLLASVIADPPEPLSIARPDVPPALAAAVMRCLEKDPRQRPQTIADFARSLAPFAPAPSQSSIERVSKLLPSSNPMMAADVASSPTMFAATQGSLPPPQGVSGAGNTNRGWGNTKPSEAPKKSSALFGAVIGGACVLALVGLGLVGFVAMRRASVPAATAAPPPAVSVVPTATAVETAPPVASASPPPAASASASAAAKKKPSSKPSHGSTDNGDLGGAIDSRK